MNGLKAMKSPDWVQTKEYKQAHFQKPNKSMADHSPNRSVFLLAKTSSIKASGHLSGKVQVFGQNCSHNSGLMEGV